MHVQFIFTSSLAVVFIGVANQLPNLWCRFDESNEGEEEDEVGTLDGSGDRAEDGDG